MYVKKLDSGYKCIAVCRNMTSCCFRIALLWNVSLRTLFLNTFLVKVLQYNLFNLAFFEKKMFSFTHKYTKVTEKSWEKATCDFTEQSALSSSCQKVKKKKSTKSEKYFVRNENRVKNDVKQYELTKKSCSRTHQFNFQLWKNKNENIKSWKKLHSIKATKGHVAVV